MRKYYSGIKIKDGEWVGIVFKKHDIFYHRAERNMPPEIEGEFYQGFVGEIKEVEEEMSKLEKEKNSSSVAFQHLSTQLAKDFHDAVSTRRRSRISLETRKRAKRFAASDLLKIAEYISS